MRFPSLFLLAIVLVFASTLARAGDSETGDANGIVGTWKMIKSVVSGKEQPNDVGIVWEIAKDKVVISDPKGHASDVGTLKYTLKPEKQPAEIDVERETEKNKQVDTGIYKLEKGKLTFAMPLKHGGDRPKTFEDKALVVFTFERVKKAK